MTDEVLVDVADGIMTVTLNRPEAKNAANKALAEGVAAAMDELDSNDDIKVAILTGAGGTFCAGMDLKAFVSGETPQIEGRGFAGLTEQGPRKPLIAAVEGYALAGGLELAISCDLIVTADNAKFGIPETKRGLAAAAGGLMKLPQQIPPRIAMELALTGEFIGAERAASLGLVNHVVPAGTALDAAKELAAKIVANGPLAVAVSKQVILESADWTAAEMWQKQGELVMPVFVSEDAIEGATAFAEKRAPNWKGK
jgi:enoyl-CoA hydratase